MSMVLANLSRRLLSGEIICRWTDSEAHAILEQEDVQFRINNKIEFLGAKLVSTPERNGFYLVMDPETVDIEKRSKEVFTDIMKNYRSTLSWVKVFMKAIAPDRTVMGGDIFRLVDIHHHVEADTTMQNDLHRIKGVKGESIRKQLESIVGDLLKAGIIVEYDKKHERYVFTAKMDLINQYLEFIVDHESITVEELPSSQQALLL